MMDLSEFPIIINLNHWEYEKIMINPWDSAEKWDEYNKNVNNIVDKVCTPKTIEILKQCSKKGHNWIIFAIPLAVDSYNTMKNEEKGIVLKRFFDIYFRRKFLPIAYRIKIKANCGKEFAISIRCIDEKEKYNKDSLIKLGYTTVCV